MEDYKVIRAIGKGSFGKVYLVKHAKENRQYVMKVIKLKGIPPKEREACRNEVMLMKRLAHPNIVAYKDSFFANGQDNLCIVMTFCDGGDLSARLAAAGGQLFKEDQIMHWFVQIALATHYMHENKVLHRDIKTQNVFLLGNGRLVMGDLGISKVLDGTVQFASTQIGTPYYMSPELFKNKPYNHKSDVWALGCVLYELCTLHHPFDATSLQGLAAKIGKGAYAPISPKYSQSLHALVKSMLALEPRQRPSVPEVLTQPYLKKHIYNFLKDIAERAALGLGAAAPSGQVMAGKAPISEGTMVFKAAAMKAGGVGASGPDAAAHAAAAGLGPHAVSLQSQLVSLGLKDVAMQALQDAIAGAQGVSPPISAGAGAGAAAMAPALKPAYSLANLNNGAPAPRAAAAAPGGAVPVRPAAAAAAPVPSTASSAASAASAGQPPVGAVPLVMGPDGRPLSPNRARKYLKEQQAALLREEERKKAVELALQRLKQEKDLRVKGRDDLRRKQEARLSGVGLPSAGAYPGMAGGAPGQGGPLSAALPSGQAAAAAQAQAQAVRAYMLGNQPSAAAAGIAAAGAGAKVAVGAVAAQAGLPPRPAAIGIPSLGPGGPLVGQRPSVASSAAAGVAGVRGVSVASSNPSSANNSRASSHERGALVGSAPGSRPSSSGQGSGSAPSMPVAGDKGSELRERAERIRRDQQAAEAARKARNEVPVKPAAGPGGALSARPSVSGGSAGVGSANGLGVQPTASDRDRQRVADLDHWEREKGVLPAAVAGAAVPGRASSVGARQDAMGAAARVIAAGKPVPIGVSHLQAAAAAQGIAPVNVGARPSNPSREPSSERAVAAAAGSAVSKAVDKGLGDHGSAYPGGVPPGRVSASASISSSVSMAPSEGGAMGAVVSGRPAAGAAGALRVAAPVSGPSGRSSGPSPVPGQGSSSSAARAPSPVVSSAAAGGSGPSPAAAAAAAAAAADEPSSKARVMALKEARKRAEEEMHKQQLEAAARDAATERKRAQYMSREAYRGINAAVVGGLPVPSAVLDASLEEANDLVKTLSQALPGARYGAGGDSKEGSGRYTEGGKSSEDEEDSPASAVAAGGSGKAADELPNASQYDGVPTHAAKEGPVLGRDGLPLDYVPAPVPEDAVGASTRRGELPADLEEDSEDEVWLESGQALPPADGRPTVAVPSGVGGRSALTSPPAMVEDDDDIVESESALRAELARSTLRCAELRQSLVVARKVAETVGVPMPPPSARGRRSSGVNSVAAASVVATAGLMPLPPAAYGAAGPSSGSASAASAAAQARPTIVDDRPIRPAPGSGVPAPAPASSSSSSVVAPIPGSGAAAAATAKPAGNLPPRPGGVLAPSAAAKAAAGGYMQAGSSRGPSPTPLDRKQSPSPVPSGGGSPVRPMQSNPGALSPPSVDPHSPPRVDPVTGRLAGGRPHAEGAAAGAETYEDIVDEELEDDALMDEDDLRDEDGDEEGQVAFAPRPLVGRTPAGKMHSATIREEDEDEDDDDEGPFGGEFKSRLGIEQDGDEDGEGSGRLSSFAGGAGVYHDANGGRVLQSPAVGGLSSRVEDLRKRCISALGPALYEQVYAAVKEVAWDGGSEGAEPGGDPDAEEQEVAAIPGRFGLSASQAHVVHDIALLLQMEQDLM